MHSRNNDSRVLVIQRRMTEYRVPLFERMRDQLGANGIRLDVAYGRADNAETERNDEGVLPWAHRVVGNSFHLGVARLIYQNISADLLRQQNLVVIPHEASMLLNYRLLARRLSGCETNYAFWGHGRNLKVTGRRWLSEAIKKRSSTFVDWWFAYTSLSVQGILREGFPENRITCLNNSVDTKQLVEWRTGIGVAEQQALRRTLGLNGTHVGIFLGSLSIEKRLPFLFEAADKIHEKLPAFELLILGDGPARSSVIKELATRPWCKWLGAKHGREKVLYLSLGHVLLNPGMVGLGILDAFAMRLPLVTTDCGIHSPEIAYLHSGVNGLMVSNDAHEFAIEVTHVLLDTARRNTIADAASQDLKFYSLEKMCDNFCDGIASALVVDPLNRRKRSSPATAAVWEEKTNSRYGLNRKVIATTSSYMIGLTGLLTEQALSISERCAPGQFLFISGEREQFPGLLAKLRRHSVRNEIIEGFDTHKRFLRLVKEFDRYIDDFRPDVVHVNTNWQLVIAVLAKLIYRHRFSLIYTIHGYRHNYPVRSILARLVIGGMLYLFADRVIAPSSFLRRQFSVLESKLDTLFIGVDQSFFGAYVPLSVVGPKRIVFAGEFREGKNQDILIRVLQKYIQLTGDSEVELHLPGKGINLSACMTLSKQLGLVGKVFFPGFVDRQKMLEYYQICQFAVVPSNVETFGQCISEPFSLGRIVMTRRVGIAEDVIVPGETGYLFDTEEELLQVLITVLPNSNTWARVSRTAYDRRQVFEWSSIADRYLEIINRL